MREIIPRRPMQDYIKDKIPGISFEMAFDWIQSDYPSTSAPALFMWAQSVTPQHELTGLLCSTVLAAHRVNGTMIQYAVHRTVKAKSCLLPWKSWNTDVLIYEADDREMKCNSKENNFIHLVVMYLIPE